MPNALMAHMVAFYPDAESSLATARALADGGARYIEVQFPFSDPTADGPLIQEACRLALERGFKVRRGFELVRAIGDECETPVFIMVYANTVFFHGVEPFLEAAARCGARGVIVPDLPHDYDEGLFKASERRGIEAVPVVAPSTGDERLKAILSCGSGYVYAALRAGITGAYTEIGACNIAFLERVAGHGKKILAGFGISERRQVEALAPRVHACVVGSAFLKVIAETAKNRPNGMTPVTGIDRRDSEPDADAEVDRRDRTACERLYRAVRNKIESLI
jgi:tryptophan synthase alpha chain